MTWRPLTDEHWQRAGRVASLGILGIGWGLAFGLAGCSDAPAVDDPPSAACPCSDQACPSAVCGLIIEISTQTCAGEVGRVEVMLGDQLDPEPIELGAPRQVCAGISRGNSLPLRARADTDWQWLEDVACPQATADETSGPVLTRVLNCQTAAP